MKAGRTLRGPTRRAWLASAAGLLAACREALRQVTGGWVADASVRGHRWRDRRELPAAAVQRHCDVLVIGGGVAGLAALRAAVRNGHAEAQLLEIEPDAGGNSRGHAIAGIGCPLGAHYLPLPGPEAREVGEWLYEIGLLRHEAGRTVADERHLCHAPQERLWVDGAWVDGLLPPADPGSPTMAQYRAFAAAVAQQHGHTLPAHRAPASARGAQAALDAMTFSAWLDRRGLVDERLRWYLDYCCRDDYGAGLHEVSAWAGVHYYASRHGFHAPGEAERDGGVFTWPEGNAWLVEHLVRPLRERVHTGCAALRVTAGRHGVQVLAWNEAASRAEAWTAQTVVLAVPLFVAARVVQNPPTALAEAAAATAYAPWLVANLHLDGPLVDRAGAPPSWDNVVYGSTGLGYVDAMHQSLRPHAGPTVLTVYHALPRSEREALLSDDWRAWLQRVTAPLLPVHPDLPLRLRHAALARWGHAMAIPVPGLSSQPARQALRAERGRLRYAHADLAGYSVFEEAFIAGCEAIG